MLQKTCSAFNFQSGSSAAYDGTPTGNCQLVSGTQGGSDNLSLRQRAALHRRPCDPHHLSAL